MGQIAADGDFKEAIQRLGDSGMFSDAAYSYSSSATGVKLEIQLTDVDRSKLVPAHFENFVWFTDDELQAALQKRVPLFKQLLPLGGNLADHVTEALQATLTDQKLPGRVSYLREAHDQTGGELVAVAYRVDEVSIRIQGVEFPGASPEQSRLLESVAHRLIGAEYTRTSLAAFAKFDALPIYLQRGYLKADFSPSQARVESKTDADPQASDEVEVKAILPVKPGSVYSTSAVDWKGNSALTTRDLAPLLHLPLGQPADAIRLSRDVDSVTKLYRSRGYMMVNVKPDAHLDDEKSTVHYDLNVTEGDLYKMGELEIAGLDTQSTARLRSAWTLREGDPYNADYPNKFVAGTLQLLPRSVRWGVKIDVTPNAKDKTVDVEIRFRPE